ncbi:alkyl sulfatase dimerization domain-containing protein, partial [Arthrospira platensis SPKY2]
MPPSEAGARYVEVIGGPDRLVGEARRAAEAGEYRWAAELLNHLVFAQPDHEPARSLQAEVLEQLGYQSESATFRNAYLTAAQELRNGTMPPQPIRRSGYLDAMETGQLLESLAVRLRAEELGGVAWAFELVL